MCPTSENSRIDRDGVFDAVIVGAGFAGLYALHRLRKIGLSCRVYEGGGQVGGTWHWNRYPGARCDAESLAYSFSFDSNLEQEWEWSERYAAQPEILEYIEHVAVRFDLLPDIRFGRRVQSAHYDEASRIWRIETDRGDTASARFCILATGNLSTPAEPNIKGLDTFTGRRFTTSRWPNGWVDFEGERVGVIGTGSSGIQCIPRIAEQAKHLSVFQRTANFSIPARNGPIDSGFSERFKARYQEHREFFRRGLTTGFGDLAAVPRTVGVGAETAAPLSDQELDELCEEYWSVGGLQFLSVVGDSMTDEAANKRIADFVREKIRQTVFDTETAESLCPTTYPIGSKRLCTDHGYYESFNRENVDLVDLRKSPIEAVEANGIRISDRFIELDALVLATGFDAMTGSLLRIDFRGVGGVELKKKWEDGPRAYLGLMVSDFPNLFIVTGPGSPSVLSNVVLSIEQHVDFIADCISHMSAGDHRTVEAEAQAEEDWMERVAKAADKTLFSQGASWYRGVNIPGKPVVFMAYVGGVGAYREACENIVSEGYAGFHFKA